MITLAALLHAAAHQEVEYAGLLWRIRRLDMATSATGRAALALVSSVTPGPGRPAPQITEELLLRSVAVHHDLVAAGLEAVKVGNDWISLTFVEPDQRDPDAGKITIADLPGGAVPFFTKRIQELATSGEVAQARVESFLRGVADQPGPDGAAVRPAPQQPDVLGSEGPGIPGPGPGGDDGGNGGG